MPATAIDCPLCQSTRVRIIEQLAKVMVCACDACNAQFTVSRPAKPYLPTAK